MQTVAQGWLVLALTGSPFVPRPRGRGPLDPGPAPGRPGRHRGRPVRPAPDRHHDERRGDDRLGAAGHPDDRRHDRRRDRPRHRRRPRRHERVRDAGPPELRLGADRHARTSRTRSPSTRCCSTRRGSSGRRSPGILVALVGPGWAFVINAISFVPVIIGLLLISQVHVPRVGVAARTAVPEAVRYLRGEPRVAALLGAARGPDDLRVRPVHPRAVARARTSARAPRASACCSPRPARARSSAACGSPRPPIGPSAGGVLLLAGLALAAGLVGVGLTDVLPGHAAVLRRRRAGAWSRSTRRRTR